MFKRPLRINDKHRNQNCPRVKLTSQATVLHSELTRVPAQQGTLRHRVASEPLFQ
jgi:hypothetical protein